MDGLDLDAVLFRLRKEFVYIDAKLCCHVVLELGIFRINVKNASSLILH